MRLFLTVLLLVSVNTSAQSTGDDAEDARQEAALKKRCGKDAHHMQKGMSFARVKSCSGLDFEPLNVDALRFKAYSFFDPGSGTRGQIQVEGDVITVISIRR